MMQFIDKHFTGLSVLLFLLGYFLLVIFGICFDHTADTSKGGDLK
jgi:hypothetical protein